MMYCYKKGGKTPRGSGRQAGRHCGSHLVAVGGGADVEHVRGAVIQHPRPAGRDDGPC
jgi:hypothetical protein